MNRDAQLVRLGERWQAPRLGLLMLPLLATAAFVGGNKCQTMQRRHNLGDCSRRHACAAAVVVIVQNERLGARVLRERHKRAIHVVWLNAYGYAGKPNR
jgi:hypothetical protein